jgi:hypothetical protein
MLEKDMEDLIAQYPSEFFHPHEFTLIGRQGTLPGVGRYDLLFQDSRGTKILMELKAQPAKYADADQLAKYYNALKDSGQKGILLWVVATSIQHAVREVLDNVGIEYSEIHPAQYVWVAEKYGVKLRSETPEPEPTGTATTADSGTDEAEEEATSQRPKEEKRMSRYRGSTVYVHVLAELVRAAQYRGVTTYQDLAVIMGLPMKGSNMGRQIGDILGDIVEDEVSAGRPMLSAVVVSVNGRPGPGFFNFAREIGRIGPTQSEDEFWRQEREAVYEAWRRPLPK